MRRLERLYEEGRGRIAALVRGLDDGQDATTVPVPACPEWSVHDVLAHMTGVCADILSGNISGAGTDEWTAAQVASRRAFSTDEVLAEWADVGPKVAAMVDDFPGRYGAQVVTDITTHEHDLRGAVRRPEARTAEPLPVALDFLTAVVAHPMLVARGQGPLEIVAEGRTWTVGNGGPPTGDRDSWRRFLNSTDPIPAPASAPVGRLEAEPFELLRALTGRRSPAQIRALRWTVDPEPFLPMFGGGPFSIREADLVE